MGISGPDTKKLFSRSAGRCNICGNEIIEEDVVVGEMAHVIPRSPGGPRGEYQYEGNVDSHENIVLLCLKHHRIVDRKPSEYPPERLYKIKENFENYVKGRLDTSSFRRDNISALGCLFEYIPFLNMLVYIEELPDRLDVDFFDFIEQFDTFTKTNRHLYPFHDPDLQQKLEDLVAVQRKIDAIVGGVRGAMLYDQTNIVGSRFVACLNRSRISDQDLQSLQGNIAQLYGSYVPAYSEFMAYVKDFYPEVNMNAWRPDSMF